MGNRMMTIEAMIQLAAVEKGTILGWTIYGIYSHTNGPKDSPKTAMNRKRPMIIKGCLRLFSASRKNPTVMIPEASPSKSAP